MQQYALLLHEWRRGVLVDVASLSLNLACCHSALTVQVMNADFFHSSLGTRFLYVVAFICLVYTTTFFLFGIFWWAELA